MRTFRTLTLLALIVGVVACDSHEFAKTDALTERSGASENETVLGKLPPLPGAIFTTLADGSVVNGNIYAAKCDVYLDGGPGINAPPTAASLPDGDYYFQVTDPSGKTLLSTDPVENRQFNVTGGLITGNSGLGNHVTGVDADHGAATIQLCPFDDTPNPGGVYKVWATRVSDFDGDPTIVDNGYSPGYFHGFIPAFSKTDNFKVGENRKPFASLTIIKFWDRNGNGVFDADEEERPYPVAVFDPFGTQINGILFTPVTLSNLVSGDYTVEIQPGRAITATILDGVPTATPENPFVIELKNKHREFVFGAR